MVFLSPLGWVLFLPVFLKIQMTVLFFAQRKKKDSLPLSVMETYPAYSKSAQYFSNVKT